MAAHRYWRIWFDKTQGDANIAVGELQFRSTPGGANWATGGTPLSSANFDINHTPDKAFDGTATTRWASPNTNANRVGHWLGYDAGIGNAFDLAEIVLTARSDVAPNQNVKEARIEWSDNGWWWVRDWALSNLPAWTLGETRTYTRPALTNQPYWRVYGLRTASTVQAYSEIELRAVLGGPTITTGGTPFATSEFNASFLKANAFDGNGATAWASANGDFDPAWIGYQFASGVSIVQASVRARTDSNPEQTPQDISLDASPDGKVWVVFWQWYILTWALGTTWILTPPANDKLLVPKIADSALTGSSDKFLVSKIGDSALTGASSRLAISKVGMSELTGDGTRLAVGKVAESVLTGAYPFLSVAKIGISVLISPSPRSVNGPVQIIGG